MTKQLMKSLGRWLSQPGVRPPWQAWRRVLGECADPGALSSAERSAFLLDRVHERDDDALGQTLALVPDDERYRPCRPRRRVAARPRLFSFDGEVCVAALGERGEQVAALTHGGKVQVIHVATGRRLVQIALGPPSEHAQVAVSDTLRTVVAWRGEGEVVALRCFGRPGGKTERLRWVDHRIECARDTWIDRPVDMLEALLAYQEARPDWREVGDNAKSWRRHDATWIYERPDLGLVLRPTIDDPSVLELLPGEQAGGPRTNHCAGLAVADGKIAVREGRWIRVLDLGGRELQRLDAGNAKWHRGIPGVADFVEQVHVEADPTDHAEGTLTRLEPGPGGLVLRPVGLCTFTDGAPVDPRLWQYHEGTWHRPGGEPVAPPQPRHGLTAELAEDQAQHVLVRDREGHVVADWWSAVPLNQAAMVSASELALLTERLEVIVLDVDLPS